MLFTSMALRWVSQSSVEKEVTDANIQPSECPAKAWQCFSKILDTYRISHESYHILPHASQMSGSTGQPIKHVYNLGECLLYSH